VLEAARDAKILGQLTVITTDLFPALVPEMRSGAVEATIYSVHALRAAWRSAYYRSSWWK